MYLPGVTAIVKRSNPAVIDYVHDCDMQCI